MKYIKYSFEFFVSVALRLGGACLAFFFALMVTAAPAMAEQQGSGERTASVVNILLLGVIAYFLVRAFRRRSGGGDKPRSDVWKAKTSDEAAEQGRVIKAVDRHEAARLAWGALSSNSKNAETADLSHPDRNEFDEMEFLEGAKLLFSHFQQIETRQDLDALKPFLSDEIFAATQTDLESCLDRGKVEIMLVTAKLMEKQTRNGRTTITVFYDAQIRKGNAGDESEHVRTVWEFSRDDSVQNGLWALERINKVDQ